MKPITQIIPVPNKHITLSMRREDLIHSQISGNKWRKLKYNLLQAKAEGHDCLLTFGGAFSNHIAAVAAAGKAYGFKTVGIIRGEELVEKIFENPTLSFSQECGMTLRFVSRQAYQTKEDPEFILGLQETFGAFYLLPEGGTNALAIKGCEEILTNEDAVFDYICCAVGTGGTLTGLVNSSSNAQHVLGFSALKGNFLKGHIGANTNRTNWEIFDSYHFGGYGKITAELVHFMNDFHRQTNIPLDPIYTAKLVYGVMDMIHRDFFPEDSRILLIHTGGLQGIAGMNRKLKNKKLPLIEIDD